MASFSLRSQRTGQYKSFTLLEVLKLLGDRVNDEILLEDGEDVYNLSSFQEIGSGGNGGTAASEYWSVETPASTSGLDTFYLQYQPSAINGHVLLEILNGMVQTVYQDFSQNGKEIKFPFRLTGQDSLKFIYPIERPVNFS